MSRRLCDRVNRRRPSQSFRKWSRMSLCCPLVKERKLCLKPLSMKKVQVHGEPPPPKKGLSRHKDSRHQKVPWHGPFPQGQERVWGRRGHWDSVWACGYSLGNSQNSSYRDCESLARRASFHCCRPCSGNWPGSSHTLYNEKRQANVMVEYPVEEAETLLDSKLTAAQTSLKQVDEDLAYLKEQITTMEVELLLWLWL